MKSESKGRDLFFGVVAIATLIVAIVGATLAYFSVTASSNEGAVNATAAIVSIEYNDGQQVTAQADQLIPSTLEVVQTVYEDRIAVLETVDGQDPNEMGNACIDSNNRQVCSAYRFTIRSDIERTITATLNNEENGFTYLSYAVYNVTKGEWMSLTDEDDYSLPLTSCTNENNDGDNANLEDDCYTMTGLRKVYSTETPEAVNSIFGKTLVDGQPAKKGEPVTGTTQVYDLVLFIKETNENQNIDQGKNYRGTLIVDVLEGGATDKITGCVGDNCY